MKSVVSRALRALEARAGMDGSESYITLETYTVVLPLMHIMASRRPGALASTLIVDRKDYYLT